MAARLADLVGGFDEVLAPLAIGEQAHVDHRIVRGAAAAAWKRHPRLLLRLYEDVPYIGQVDRDRASGPAGLALTECPIDLPAKLRLIQGYASQPIESWEELIRRAAGHPSVERTWIVSGPDALGRLE